MANGTLKVQNIETSSGSGTITLGQSGETIALGSGVTSKLNQPAFEAYLGTDQSISNATYVKAEIDTKIFDTDSCYDTTNYRFTPTVAGKYFVYTNLRCRATNFDYVIVALYKNGSSEVQNLNLYEVNGTVDGFSANLQSVVDMNGTTDYLEIFVYLDADSSRSLDNGVGKECRFGAYRIGAE